MSVFAVGQVAGLAPSYGVNGAELRALLGLAAVAVLMGGLVYLVRRGIIPLPGRRGSGPLAVESTLPLGERRSLLLVDVEGRRLLLGVTASAITLVAELAAKPPFDRVLDGARGTPPAASS